MAKAKDRRAAARQYAQILATVAGAQPAAPVRPLDGPESDGALPMMKKFRFQLLHQWLTTRLTPRRMADVGGGKGLLAYLLQESGWTATVIDPEPQALPVKYKDLNSKKQVRIAEHEQVRRLNQRFDPAATPDYDLLVAMHAHGCNLQLINAAAAHRRDIVLLPCCVIDEPQLPPPGVSWLQWLADYMLARDFIVEPFQLNFKGQNIGFYARAGAAS